MAQRDIQSVVIGAFANHGAEMYPLDRQAGNHSAVICLGRFWRWRRRRDRGGLLLASERLFIVLLIGGLPRVGPEPDADRRTGQEEKQAGKESPHITYFLVYSLPD